MKLFINLERRFCQSAVAAFSGGRWSQCTWISDITLRQIDGEWERKGRRYSFTHT